MTGRQTGEVRHVRSQCAVRVATEARPPALPARDIPDRLEPYGYAVVVINLTTRHVYAPITVGGYPTAVAITA
jgi:hypothetical protein